MINEKCITKHCRKRKLIKGFYCASCVKRKYAERHPVKYAYTILKNNAKRRGVYFDLTFNQFSKFCTKYDYISGKGKTRESLSIDRIDNTKGYTESNIRVLTLSENSAKGKKTLNAYYDYIERKVIATVSTRRPDVENWEDIFDNVSADINNIIGGQSIHNSGCGCEDCELPF